MCPFRSSQSPLSFRWRVDQLGRPRRNLIAAWRAVIMTLMIRIFVTKLPQTHYANGAATVFASSAPAFPLGLADHVRSALVNPEQQFLINPLDRCCFIIAQLRKLRVAGALRETAGILA